MTCTVIDLWIGVGLPDLRGNALTGEPDSRQCQTCSCRASWALRAQIQGIGVAREGMSERRGYKAVAEACKTSEKLGSELSRGPAAAPRLACLPQVVGATSLIPAIHWASTVSVAQRTHGASCKHSHEDGYAGIYSSRVQTSAVLLGTAISCFAIQWQELRRRQLAKYR